MPPELPTVNPPAQPSNGKTILIAEDDPFISRMYQFKLEAAGYNVQMVTNGREAYEQFRALKPQLALMDINMPELTGLQVIKALQKEGEENLGQRIMVLTNSSNSEDKKVTDSMGIEYIVKAEMTPREVLDKITAKLA